MFRRKHRDEGRRIGAAVASFMDEIEAQTWANSESVDVVDIVEHLLAICGGNVGHAMQALEVWQGSREKRYDREGDEDRLLNVGGVYMAVALNGIGNVFGMIPDTVPGFDSQLAAIGRAKGGWRR